jgi:ribosomal protein S18 acetylase RimI-like enzyme
MDTVCRELEKQGAHKVHLFVFNENLEAIGFYQRLGWNRRTDIQVMSSDRSFITNTID